MRNFVYNENNQLIDEYYYFGLRPVAVKTNGVLHIVHTDYLGTPRVITNGTSGGSIVWEWKNDNPYGNNKAEGNIEFNIRFAGQYYDYESSLHYNIYRTYNPETGRYLQSDPIGLAGGFNTYNYVNKNPLDGVDPLGLYTRVLIVTPKNIMGIGHVAISVNGNSYGLMPVALKNTKALFNTQIEGTLDSYSENDFIEHYANGKEHGGSSFFDTVSTYDLQLTQEQERRLELRLKSQRYIFLPYMAQEQNCATFISNILKEFVNSSFETNKYPWTMKNYMEELSDSGLVKRGKTYKK